MNCIQNETSAATALDAVIQVEMDKESYTKDEDGSMKYVHGKTRWRGAMDGVLLNYIDEDESIDGEGRVMGDGHLQGDGDDRCGEDGKIGELGGAENGKSWLYGKIGENVLAMR